LFGHGVPFVEAADPMAGSLSYVIRVHVNNSLLSLGILAGNLSARRTVVKRRTLGGFLLDSSFSLALFYP
jgi:hypothetical protein